MDPKKKKILKIIFGTLGICVMVAALVMVVVVNHMQSKKEEEIIEKRRKMREEKAKAEEGTAETFRRLYVR